MLHFERVEISADVALQSVSKKPMRQGRVQCEGFVRVEKEFYVTILQIQWSFLQPTVSGVQTCSVTGTDDSVDKGADSKKV